MINVNGIFVTRYQCWIFSGGIAKGGTFLATPASRRLFRSEAASEKGSTKNTMIIGHYPTSISIVGIELNRYVVDIIGTYTLK